MSRAAAQLRNAQSKCTCTHTANLVSSKLDGRPAPRAVLNWTGATRDGPAAALAEMDDFGEGAGDDSGEAVDPYDVMAAARDGKAEVLRGMIEAGFDIVSEPLYAIEFAIRFGQDMTALMFASAHGQTECVRVLLGAGASANTEAETDHMSPLLWACRGGHAECVRELLDAGADMWCTFWGELDGEGYGWNALAWACGHGHLACVDLLLEAGALASPVPEWCEGDGLSALRAAAAGDHAPVIRALINNPRMRPDYGADDMSGGSIVELATQLDVLQLLCALGCSRRLLLDDDDKMARLPAESRAWLIETRQWVSRLHYLEILTPAQVRESLREGFSVHASDGSEGAPTPLGIARAVLQRQRTAGGACECAQLVVDADKPWSRHNHSLFPWEARERAVQLLRVGQQLARQPRFAAAGHHCQVALLDVWMLVMAHALVRATGH